MYDDTIHTKTHSHSLIYTCVWCLQNIIITIISIEFQKVEVEWKFICNHNNRECCPFKMNICACVSVDFVMNEKKKKKKKNVIIFFSSNFNTHRNSMINIIFCRLNTVNCGPQTIVIRHTRAQTHTTMAIFPYVRKADTNLCCRCNFSCLTTTTKNEEENRNQPLYNFDISIKMGFLLLYDCWLLHVDLTIFFSSCKCAWAHLNTPMFQHTHISCSHTLHIHTSFAGLWLVFFRLFSFFFCYYNFFISMYRTTHSKPSNDASTVLHTVTYD